MQKPTLKPLPKLLAKPLKALLKQPLKALPTQLLLLLAQPLKPLKQPLKPLKAPLLLLKKLLSKLFATSESGRAVPQGAALFFCPLQFGQNRLTDQPAARSAAVVGIAAPVAAFAGASVTFVNRPRDLRDPGFARRA